MRFSRVILTNFEVFGSMVFNVLKIMIYLLCQNLTLSFAIIIVVKMYTSYDEIPKHHHGHDSVKPDELFEKCN